MAEKKENSELINQLKEEFDVHLKEVFEKNKDFQYSEGLNAENLEEVTCQVILGSYSSFGLKLKQTFSVQCVISI